MLSHEKPSGIPMTPVFINYAVAQGVPRVGALARRIHYACPNGTKFPRTNKCVAQKHKCTQTTNPSKYPLILSNLAG